MLLMQALPQAGRAVFNAMDSSCQAGSSIDGMNSESEVPPGFAPAQPQELPGFSQVPLHAQLLASPFCRTLHATR